MIVPHHSLWVGHVVASRSIGAALTAAAVPPPALFTARTSKAYTLSFVRFSTVFSMTSPASLQFSMAGTDVPAAYRYS